MPALRKTSKKSDEKKKKCKRMNAKNNELIELTYVAGFDFEHAPFLILNHFWAILTNFVADRERWVYARSQLCR